VSLAGAAQSDALVERDPVSHNGGFPDHHPGRVVDEQTPPQHRARVDIDAGKEACNL